MAKVLIKKWKRLLGERGLFPPSPCDKAVRGSEQALSVCLLNDFVNNRQSLMGRARVCLLKSEIYRYVGFHVPVYVCISFACVFVHVYGEIFV